MTARPGNRRFHRTVEAMDDACLRAWGHPHDRAIRQELLSAMEWDDSVRSEHEVVLPLRDVFKRLWSHC
jgi:hypothetical protein